MRSAFQSRLSAIMLASAALFASSQAAAQSANAASAEPPAVPAPPVVVEPTWAQHPMPFYPESAMKDGVSGGEVVLTCVVSTQGSVSDCDVVDETPGGYGFARAAIASAQRARATPRIIDGVATEGPITFTIRFATPQGGPTRPPRKRGG